LVGQDLEQLLALQRVDLALDTIAKREEEARARLKAGQEDLARIKVEAENEKRLLNDALKEHKTLDLDLKKNEDEVKKYSTQMYEVKTNKEYLALKEEIDKRKADAAKIEDRILQLMLREDEMKGMGARRNAEAAENDKRLKQLEAETSELLATLAKDREENVAKRAEEGAKLGPNLLRRYEQIRKFRGGSPVAKVMESSKGGDPICSECHMTIRPQIIVDIYKSEELVACESCGRILFLDVPAPEKA